MRLHPSISLTCSRKPFTSRRWCGCGGCEEAAGQRNAEAWCAVDGDGSRSQHSATSGTAFLRPGGAEKAAESAILSENEPDVLQTDILKLATPAARLSHAGPSGCSATGGWRYCRRRGKSLRHPSWRFSNDCSKAVLRRCAQSRRRDSHFRLMEIVSRFLALGLIRTHRMADFKPTLGAR